MKEIKYYLDNKEISFEELSKLPTMFIDREKHTMTEMKLNYIDKDAIYFYYQEEDISHVNDNFIKNSSKFKPIKTYKDGELPYEMSEKYLDKREKEAMISFKKSQQNS